MLKPDSTEKILARLPYWFAMKKKPSGSVGKAFLRVIGMELDELLSTLDYMYEQLSIDTVDLEMRSDCYKVILPAAVVLPLKLVQGDGKTVYPLTTLQDFYNYRNNLENYETLQDVDAYYLDEERKILYSRKNYEAFSVQDDNNVTYPLMLHFHPIWNYFDEFGLLLNVPRNFGESNQAYKVRLQDVFKNPASSTYQGLANGLARELGCRVELVLDDSSKDLEFQEDMVLPTHTLIDGSPVPESRLKKNSSGRTVLLGDADNQEKTVSYIHSIELHAMNEYLGQEDIPFESELFYSNGEATEKLKAYGRKINELCPIMWNHARWDESRWIKDLPDFGYVPNLYDASITGFRVRTENDGLAGGFVADQGTVI